MFGDMGGADTHDFLSGVDALVERGIADPKRIAVMGGSYRGYTGVPCAGRPVHADPRLPVHPPGGLTQVLTAAEHRGPDDRLVDPIGAALDRIATRLDANCLLEAPDGRIVGHALFDPPPHSVASAVLSRTSAPLHEAASRRRTVAVLAGGSVTSVSLTGWRGAALAVPVTAGGAPLGWLWILTTASEHPDMEALGDAAADIAQATCGLLGGQRDDLLEPLRTSRSGRVAALLGQHAEQLWVAAVTAEGTPARTAAGALVLAVRANPCRPSAAMRITTDGDVVYLVIGTPATTSATTVQRAVESVMSGVRELKLSAVLSEPATSTQDLPAARAQVDIAVTVAVPGRCLRLDEARPRVVLARLSDAVAALPDLGPDPLQPLLDYDARKRTDFAQALLAWLDCNGDATMAAELLGLHHNTLRYRVTRAQHLLPVDLHCPMARIEIHLRLRGAHTQRRRD